jgi:hypothetical protein
MKTNDNDMMLFEVPIVEEPVTGYWAGIDSGRAAADILFPKAKSVILKDGMLVPVAVLFFSQKVVIANLTNLLRDDIPNAQSAAVVRWFLKRQTANRDLRGIALVMEGTLRTVGSTDVTDTILFRSEWRNGDTHQRIAIVAEDENGKTRIIESESLNNDAFVVGTLCGFFK